MVSLVRDTMLICVLTCHILCECVSHAHAHVCDFDGAYARVRVWVNVDNNMCDFLVPEEHCGCNMIVTTNIAPCDILMM